MIPRSAERVDVVVRAGAFDQLFTSCGFLTERSAQAIWWGLNISKSDSAMRVFCNTSHPLGWLFDDVAERARGN